MRESSLLRSALRLVVRRCRRALAVLGPNRLKALPDVPTCTEAGVPNCVFPVWNAVFAPAHTPQPVLDTLTKAVRHALDMPETQERLRDLGL